MSGLNFINKKSKQSSYIIPHVMWRYKTQCDRCKHSKPTVDLELLLYCLLAFPIGIPVLIWIWYLKVFKKAFWCYHSKVNWIEIDFNENQNCDYYNAT